MGVLTVHTSTVNVYYLAENEAQPTAAPHLSCCGQLRCGDVELHMGKSEHTAVLWSTHVCPVSEWKHLNTVKSARRWRRSDSFGIGLCSHSFGLKINVSEERVHNKKVLRYCLCVKGGLRCLSAEWSAWLRLRWSGLLMLQCVRSQPSIRTPKIKQTPAIKKKRLPQH